MNHAIKDTLLITAVSLCFIAGLVHIKKAHAHDPSTHQADSLANAKSEAYGLCCNGDDYVRVSSWETTDTGYRVMYKGHWFETPRSAKVSNMDNPDGEAKAWINGPANSLYVRCFMPGARS